MSLIRSGAFLTVGTVAQVAGGFAAQLVLMRLLTPEDFGYFALIYAAAALVQSILSLRINILIIRARDEDLTGERRALYQAALMWEATASTGVILSWLVLSGQLSVLSLVLVAAVALGHWTSQALAFSERALRYAPIVAIETGSQLAGHAVAIALVLAGAGSSALYLREMIAAGLRFSMFLSKGMVPRPHWRWIRLREWRALFREARGLWIEGLVEAAFQRTIVLSSGLIGGVAGAGIFSQAYRIALIPNQFLSPVIARLIPAALVRVEDPVRRRRLLWLSVAGLAVPLVATAAAIVPFATTLVPWLFGSHWSDAAAVLVGLAPFVVFYSCCEIIRIHALNQHFARYLVAIKVGQYLIFGAGILIAMTVPPAQILYGLALGLSLSYVIAFALMAGLLEWRAAVEGSR